MNSFVYDIPTRVYFGEHQLGNLGPELARFGHRVLLAYGGGSIKKSGLYDAVCAEIKNAGLELFEFGGIAPNPHIDSVRAGAELAKKEKIDVILAVGGGSTIDAAKFMAAGACVSFDPWKFFSEDAPVEQALPLVTVLTLSATGSEMDCGGVISNPETQDKLGRMALPLLPKVSFLDPSQTYSVCAYQTACGSADILSHLFETYFTREQDLQMLDGIMESLMKTVITYTPVALAQPDNYEARANLMWASSWAINGFVNGGKQQAWSCHPMEHEVSAVYDITHGLGLAIITPRWMEYTLDESTAERYRRFGIEVFGIDRSLPALEAGHQAIEQLKTFLYTTLGLKSTFGALGIDDTHFSTMAQKACNGGILPGYKRLNAHDIEAIFRTCL